MFTPWKPNRAQEKKVKDKFPAPTVCHYCGGEVKIYNNAVLYGTSYGDWPWMYMCVNCRACVGMHPQTNIPLGTLANPALRKLRTNAKSCFNPIWQEGEMKRTEAYAWLAEKMGIPVSQCHFGLFNDEQCKKAMAILAEDPMPEPRPEAEVKPNWKQKLLAAVTGKKIDTTPKFKSFKSAKKLEK